MFRIGEQVSFCYLMRVPFSCITFQPLSNFLKTNAQQPLFKIVSPLTIKNLLLNSVVHVAAVIKQTRCFFSHDCF